MPNDETDVVVEPGSDGTQFEGDDYSLDAGLSDGQEGADASDGEKGGVDKQLKDTQRKLTEVAQERAELRERLAKLEGQFDVLNRVPQKSEEQQTDPFEFMEREEWERELLDDPKNVASALKQMKDVFGRTLIARDKFWEERLNDVRSQVNRPTADMAARIAALKKDPDYAKLDDSVLAIIAKKQPSQRQSNPKGQYPGNGPTGSRAATTGDGVDPAHEREVKKMMEKMGY